MVVQMGVWGRFGPISVQYCQRKEVVMMKAKLVIWACLLLIVACAVASAQVTGTIMGSVVDPTDRGVAAAAITITDVNKGTTKTSTTDEVGNYNVPFLPIGTYRVSAESAGFKRAQMAEILLNVDDTKRVDFKLEVGSTTESITVEATAPLVRADSAELGEVISRGAVEELPLNGRNFALLVYLVPGVTTGQPGENLSGSSTFNPRAASNFNALGSQANANGWLVDGISDNEYTFNTVIIQPSVESVQEFKVLTGTFSAEFGRGAGVVSTQTKSGSNTLHGSAFEFLRNSYMDARNFFNAKPTLQPPFRRNQFGGSAGGAIIKNRTFFFSDYYGWREYKGQTYVNSVPTAQERTGDFSDWKQANGTLIPIYDPTSTQVVNGATVRNAFPGNVIPASMINPVSANVVSLYPLPNAPGLTSNYVAMVPRTVNDNGFNFRIDHRISDKDSAFVRYSFEHFNLNSPPGQSACCLPSNPNLISKFDLGPYVAGPQVTWLGTSGLALNETHVFGPTLVNEFVGGYDRFDPITRQSDYGHNTANSLGIMGINFDPPATTGIPGIAPGDFTGFSGGPNMAPVNPRETVIQLGDSISKTIGAHRLKFGYRYIRNLLSPYDHTNTRGAINFADNFTNNPQTSTGGNGVATLLLGWTTGGSRGVMLDVPYMTNQEHAAFFEDDWKVSRRLTLNLGLRYDVFVPDVEKYNHIGNFNLATLNMNYAGVDGVSASAGKETRYKNFGPRLGFAWDPLGTGKVVVRGGYGMSYFPEMATATGLVSFQVPWIVAQSYAPATSPIGMAGVPTINQPFAAPIPVQPMTTADLNAANPSVIGNGMNNLTPYYESWNLDVEKQFTETLLGEVAYAGSRGIHLLLGYNPDEIEPGPGTNASRRLIQPLNNMSSISEDDPRNMSNYNALQAKLTKRMSKGVQFLLSYTYGRELDYGAETNGCAQVCGVQTVTNFKAGYGPAGFGIKERFVASGLFELPFGKGKHFLNNGMPSRIFGGVEVDLISTVQTGLPFTLTMANGVNNGAPSWPNRVCSGVSSKPDPYQWYDPSCFAAPPNNTYGNSARGVLYQPGYKDFDLSALRRFQLRERLTLQLRLDAFNSLNSPIFGPPATTFNPTAAAGVNGRITSTNTDNRELQVSARFQF